MALGQALTLTQGSFTRSPWAEAQSLRLELEEEMRMPDSNYFSLIYSTEYSRILIVREDRLWWVTYRVLAVV